MVSSYSVGNDTQQTLCMLIGWVSVPFSIKEHVLRSACKLAIQGACVCWNSMPHSEMNTKKERERERERERESERERERDRERESV